VLKLRLSDGTATVFKPRSKRPLGDRRYKGEIAAYRLAVALGLDNVSRSIPRTFDAAALRPLVPDFDRDALVDGDGMLRGAIMPWIAQYRVLPIEQPAERTLWEPWVFDANASVPEDQRALASAISTVIAFDYLTANWDRWSGGNVAQDGATGTVLFVDNDGAFYEQPAADTLARQRAQLERVARFSRRFVAALRALDGDRLRSAFGEESPGVPLLRERVVEGVASRSKTVVAAVDARIRASGEASALSFE
jgi:hypothetical protein